MRYPIFGSGACNALQLAFVTEAEFDRVVDRTKMVKSHVASE